MLHLRERGCRVLAMKPFCSGGTDDVELIQSVQGDEPPRSAVNPFYFAEPLAPLAAARRRGQRIHLGTVKEAIARMERQCERLIVEGAGGVLAPLGEECCLADVMEQMGGDVVLVAPNRLGTINHTRLTIEAIQSRQMSRILVVLMGQAVRDASSRSNPLILAELLAPIAVVEVPYLGPGAGKLAALRRNAKKIKKVLARIGDPDSFCARCTKRVGRRP